MKLSPEEQERIEAEERVRIEAQEKAKREIEQQNKEAERKKLIPGCIVFLVIVVGLTLLLGYVLGLLKCSNPITNSGDSRRQTTIKTSKPGTSIADVKTYLSLLRSRGITDALVIDVAPGRVDGEIKITVADGWHYQPYQIRLQGAQNLWKTWANLHAPTKPDSARIRLVDSNGNDVGGSRALAGSLIWVQKE